MRKSLFALILVGSLLAVAATVVVAGNPAADSIPEVGSIPVPANGAAVTNADTNAAVLTEGAPPPAAADGLATAETGPTGPTSNPAADGVPDVGSVPIPASDAVLSSADEHAAVHTDAPPPAAAEGLATAAAAGPTGGTGNPAADSIPDEGSISVPAAAEAGENPPEAVPTDDAGSGLFVAVAAGPP